MSKQKCRRKEPARKKEGGRNGRSRSSLDFRLQAVNLFLRLYQNRRVYCILLFASEICLLFLFFSEKNETQIVIVVVEIKIYAMIFSDDKLRTNSHVKIQEILYSFLESIDFP